MLYYIIFGSFSQFISAFWYNAFSHAGLPADATYARAAI